MQSIYTSGDYLDQTKTWHAEDSPWKAEHIRRMLRSHAIVPQYAIEIGCGAGGILAELAGKPELQTTRFAGFDISPQAIDLARRHAGPRLEFHCGDLGAAARSDTRPDLLLAIDVFEHVNEYWSFLEQCKAAADWKVYHIPLDLHVSSVLRASFVSTRYDIGHLHYFSAESAIAVLKDTGHTIVDSTYTDGALSLFRHHRTVKRALANLPRRLLAAVHEKYAARLLGGYSLLVLAR